MFHKCISFKNSGGIQFSVWAGSAAPLLLLVLLLLYSLIFCVHGLFVFLLLSVLPSSNYEMTRWMKRSKDPSLKADWGIPMVDDYDIY